ncbi:MAG TPA: MBL fold metallo-hydrolase [Vicinamibacterales bacterium]|nr:MBL fold metallo-hydrolase [Vicinamibacterales bacterium]
MKITLLGAAGGEVTGSAYLVETQTANVLVDCGFFQGSKKVENFNRLPTSAALRRLDAVVMTHAHLDHTGRLALLAKGDYRGPIFGTRATFDLADLILRDSASLHKSDVARENRRRKAQGKPPLDVLFTDKDVARLRPLYKRVDYDRPTPVARGVTVRLVDAGHVLGSASVEMTIEDAGRSRAVVFSGDLGPRGAPLHRDPTPFKHADLVFLESTYGDRDHRSLHETAIEGREVIRKAADASARILVPAFAIGRTQLLLYLLAGAFHRKTLEPFPIYVDSPMAIEATQIYKRHVELFDEEALAMQKSGELRTQLRTVRFSRTPNESRALSKARGPCLIMAGAGMCNGGRILSHLRTSLPRPETAVLIVGFQSRGTIGRLLVDGRKTVRILGEEVPVRASIHTMGGLSGHAGQTDLLHWFESLAAARPRVILTHGEEGARTALKQSIKDRHGIEAECPGLYDVIEF